MTQATTFGAPRSEAEATSTSPEGVMAQTDESLDSLLSNNQGSGAPAYAVEGTFWVKEVSATSRQLLIMVGGDWRLLFDVNPISGEVFVGGIDADTLLAMLLTVDGTGSGLDADKLDSYHATDFIRADVSDTFSGSAYYFDGPNSSPLRIGYGGPGLDTMLALYRGVAREAYWQIINDRVRFQREAGGRFEIVGLGDARIDDSRIFTEDWHDGLLMAADAKLQGEFVSGAIPVVSATQAALTHGLGGRPSVVRVEAVCITAEDGYSVGDVVLLTVGDINGSSRGWSIRVTDTQILLRFGVSTVLITQLNPDTGAAVSFAHANWELYVRAFR